VLAHKVPFGKPLVVTRGVSCGPASRKESVLNADLGEPPGLRRVHASAPHAVQSRIDEVLGG